MPASRIPLDVFFLEVLQFRLKNPYSKELDTVYSSIPFKEQSASSSPRSVVKILSFRDLIRHLRGNGWKVYVFVAVGGEAEEELFRTELSTVVPSRHMHTLFLNI